MTESGPPTTALAANAVIVRNPRTAARTVNGKSMIVVIDHNQLHTLNESGSFLWDQCDGKTVSQLADLLATRYRLDVERAQMDVRLFLEAMLATRALSVKEA